MLVVELMIMGQIYIPLWLDLLFLKMKKLMYNKKDLHSTMVRFIICSELQFFSCFEHLHSTMVRFIIGITPKKINEFVKFTFQYG